MPTGPRIYDCFTFFNELDLLELRLNELAGVVDYFVIAEATKTFRGKPKNLIFAENRERFAQFLPQIIHVVVDDFPETDDSWVREIHQRDCVRRGLTEARPDDLLLLSDVDEIPRGQVLAGVKASPPGPSEVVCFSLDWHAYYLNLRKKDKWDRLGPRLIRLGSLVTINGLRGVYGPAASPLRDAVRWFKACRWMRRLIRRRVIEDAGWHFSWLGGFDAVAVKANSISEHRHVTSEPKDAAWARARVAGQLSVPDQYEFVPLDAHLPRYVVDRYDLYERYFLTRWE